MTKRLIVLGPHPDDELLSMWPYGHYLACGYEVRIVHVTRGEVTPASLRLDPDPTQYTGGVQPVCSWADHNYLHDPVRENFTLPTQEEIGLARLHEGMSAAGAWATIPPMPGLTSGQVYSHDENLGGQYGCDYCGSSTGTVTETAIAKADAMLLRYIDQYPNSIFWSMSPTDAHPDHAAVGIALRRRKGTPHLATTDPNYLPPDPTYGAALVNAKFFVSRLWWSTPAGQKGSRMAEQCAWYPNVYPNNYSDADLNFTRRAEYATHIRTKVLKAYTAWNPAAGSFAIGGGHSTASQFANNFGPGVTLAALWHN
jgi:LmbE family N-acetylglucosaminyl deacetylase